MHRTFQKIQIQKSKSAKTCSVPFKTAIAHTYSYRIESRVKLNLIPMIVRKSTPIERQEGSKETFLFATPVSRDVHLILKNAPEEILNSIVICWWIARERIMVESYALFLRCCISSRILQGRFVYTLVSERSMWLSQTGEMNARQNHNYTLNLVGKGNIWVIAYSVTEMKSAWSHTKVFL